MADMPSEPPLGPSPPLHGYAVIASMPAAEAAHQSMRAWQAGDIHSVIPAAVPEDPVVQMAIAVLRGSTSVSMPYLLIQGDNMALCEQAKGAWHASVPSHARPNDVPAMLLAASQYGYRHCPRVGHFVRWRARRFNSRADALGGQALRQSEEISRWHWHGVRGFMRQLAL